MVTLQLLLIKLAVAALKVELGEIGTVTQSVRDLVVAVFTKRNVNASKFFKSYSFCTKTFILVENVRALQFAIILAIWMNVQVFDFEEIDYKLTA
jgi:hypothetical protein